MQVISILIVPPLSRQVKRASSILAAHQVGLTPASVNWNRRLGLPRFG